MSPVTMVAVARIVCVCKPISLNSLSLRPPANATCFHLTSSPKYLASENCHPHPLLVHLEFSSKSCIIDSWWKHASVKLNLLRPGARCPYQQHASDTRVTIIEWERTVECSAVCHMTPAQLCNTGPVLIRGRTPHAQHAGTSRESFVWSINKLGPVLPWFVGWDLEWCLKFFIILFQSTEALHKWRKFWVTGEQGSVRALPLTDLIKQLGNSSWERCSGSGPLPRHKEFHFFVKYRKQGNISKWFKHQSSAMYQNIYDLCTVCPPKKDLIAPTTEK